MQTASHDPVSHIKLECPAHPCQPAHHLEKVLLILRLRSSQSLCVQTAEFFSPCNKQKEIRYSNRGRRRARARKHRGRSPLVEWGEWSSKSQKFPFVRESGAKRCRFFVPARTGRVWVDRRIAVWCHDACNRRTAAVAWQKMQHLVRAERDG